MADIASRVNRLTRQKLASFLPNHELIRDFELLVQDVSVAIPDAVAAVEVVAAAAQTAAGDALTAATAAQVQATLAREIADEASLAPNPIPYLLAVIRRLEARVDALERAP